MTDDMIWAGSSMEMHERRESPRATISFPLECRLLPERTYFYTVSKDLSLTGARIISDKFIPKDNLLKININLISTMIDIKARVVWCNRNRVSERYCAGIEFIEVNQPKQKKIAGFLNKIFLSE